jgi:hypothetical protein
VNFDELRQKLSDPERMCRDHERPLRECLEEAIERLRAEHYRARVRELTLLLISQGCPARDAVETAQLLEQQLAELVPPEEPGT